MLALQALGTIAVTAVAGATAFNDSEFFLIDQRTNGVPFEKITQMWAVAQLGLQAPEIENRYDACNKSDNLAVDVAHDTISPFFNIEQFNEIYIFFTEKASDTMRRKYF